MTNTSPWREHCWHVTYYSNLFKVWYVCPSGTPGRHQLAFCKILLCMCLLLISHHNQEITKPQDLGFHMILVSLDLIRNCVYEKENFTIFVCTFHVAIYHYILAFIWCKFHDRLQITSGSNCHQWWFNSQWWQIDRKPLEHVHCMWTYLQCL